eukprot:381289_1
MDNIELVSTDIRLISKIFSKIIQNPDNEKYKNLNRTKICNRFVNSENCIKILYHAGFYDHKSDNGSRLLFDSKKLIHLKNVNTNLNNNARQLLHNIHLIDNSMTELAEEGFNMDEIEAAIQMSTQNDEINDEIKYDTQLLHSTNPYDDAKQTCNILYCPHLNIICNILKQYEIFINNNNMRNNYNISQHIYKCIGNVYDNTDLINDYNHLLMNHSTEFEDIYNILNKQIYNNKSCNLSKCLLMRRNQRNRSKIKNREDVLSKLYF